MRPAYAEVNLHALRDNYRLAKRLHGGRALAVIKADAYGHGAVRCAMALADEADGFAVAFMAEAMALREAGVRAPVLVLEGVFDTIELAQACQHDIWLVVHQMAQLAWIEALPATSRPLHIWLKVDTGMHRAGIAPAEAAACYARLLACPVVGEITLMSHLARADEPGAAATRHQIEGFARLAAALGCPRSLSNSAGVLAWSGSYGDWARPGILLYGVDPLLSGRHGLRPVMRLCSAVFATRWLLPGEALGYGGSFVAERLTRVGLVALGYADGYPRRAPTGTPVRVAGELTRLIGRVSMDMLTVDLSDLPQAGVGSKVELWGPDVDINAVAEAAGTIAYELLCHVRRVPLRYLA